MNKWIKKNWGWVIIALFLFANILHDYGPEMVRAVKDIDGDNNGYVDVDDGGTNVGSLSSIHDVVSGRIYVQDDDDGATYTTSSNTLYGDLVNCGADNQTFTLPELTAAAHVGLNVCFMIDSADGTAQLNVACHANDNIEIDGADSGTAINNSGSDEKGDYICLVSIDQGTWMVFGRVGTWD
jgi:hypothetical protein